MLELRLTTMLNQIRNADVATCVTGRAPSAAGIATPAKFIINMGTAVHTVLFLMDGYAAILQSTASTRYGMYSSCGEMFFSPQLEEIPYLVDAVPCKTCTIAIHQEQHGVDGGARIDDELRRSRNTCGTGCPPCDACGKICISYLI